MRTLVTGTAGFIGSHLAEQLVARGESVVGVDSFADYYDPEIKRRNVAELAANESFELVEGNLRELDLAALLDGVEVVYHLAAQPGVRRSWGREFQVYVNENLLAAQLLLESVRESGLRRLVYASSSSIYGDAERLPTPESVSPRPVSPYGVTKLALEHLCDLYFKRSEVPVVGLRYFTVYGPRQRPDMAFNRFISAALADEDLEVFGDGLQSRDFTYVDDAVEATIAAADRGEPGGIYNVAGGSQATVLDVLGILERRLGRPVRVTHLDTVPGDARHTGGDTTRARRDLGYAPSVDLEDGIARQLASQQR